MSLEKFYKNPKEPASFGGINALRRAVGKQVKTKDIKQWLETKDSYTLHKPARRNFKKNRVIVGGIDEQFQADLLDLQSIKQFNNGYKFLLTCIDVFSKYAWAIPLKDKTGQSILKGFQKIFKERKPKSLQTDKGTEFKNKILQKYLKTINVHFFTTNNETKASIVERFHRTLMSKLTNFVTQLPSPITLDGKWEVGLAEIIYPHTWYNVNETNNMFGFDLGDGKLNTRKLSPGSYETIPDILKAMALTSHEGKINFKFNPHTKRVKIKTTDGAKVILEKGLCSMLGFQPQVIENIKESSFTADPHTEFPIFYVYSDIVQPVVVGHVEAPLLRVVRISGNDGDVINVLYDRPHYVPVIRQSFQTIEIEIRLNSGNLVPFERGKVIIVLHFRMRQIL
ncbi:uncharacterized transposon-derived protein F54H12.3 [Caerostris darwini]|uniref:Uncharacterized transposon-derived protein F54H12.3 n=1 Tax=Caerostris darwini TaxID=1538125 RepID=A0AAV4N9C0_9ARAC|nr:uncharacterized transposon-derived protein F54H12.3 [Caerostris darwini]